MLQKVLLFLPSCYKLVLTEVKQMLQYFITSKTRRKIITLFSKYPDYRVHIRGLAKITREDPGNVSRELVRLEKIGYLKAYKEANTKVYGVNQNFILFKELQGMVLKTSNKRSWCRLVVVLLIIGFNKNNNKKQKWGKKMKQIQKIIKTVRYTDFIFSKESKLEDTKRFLQDGRRQYVASAPAGFKPRSSSDFFMQ